MENRLVVARSWRVIRGGCGYKRVVYGNPVGIVEFRILTVEVITEAKHAIESHGSLHAHSDKYVQNCWNLNKVYRLSIFWFYSCTAVVWDVNIGGSWKRGTGTSPYISQTTLNLSRGAVLYVLFSSFVCMFFLMQAVIHRIIPWPMTRLWDPKLNTDLEKKILII